jgi:hypothetical protein
MPESRRQFRRWRGRGEAVRGDVSGDEIIGAEVNAGRSRWPCCRTPQDPSGARHPGNDSATHPCWTWTGGGREPAEDYAASGLKLEDTSRPGKRANTLTAETHTNRCSSSSYLARSISTFFLAASLVQAVKHAEERASMYSLSPASYARFRSLQFGQSIFCASPAFCRANRSFHSVVVQTA